MKPKTIAKTEVALQAQESERSLPDESDQIISDLEQELKQLRTQVLTQQEKHHSPSEDAVETLEIQLQIKRDEIASLREQHQDLQQQQKLLPKVAQQFQKPMSQMTSNLEQLINQVQDPDVQSVLQQCKEMALQTMQHAQTVEAQANYLIRPTQPQHKIVDVISFFRELVAQSKSASLQLYTAKKLPSQMEVDASLLQQALLVLVKEVSRMGGDETIKVTLKQGEELVYDVNIQQLEVGLLGTQSWDLPEKAEIQALLDHAVTHSEESGVDLIYAKKILEEHGGQLQLHQENGQTCGFDIKIPVAPESS